MFLNLKLLAFFYGVVLLKLLMPTGAQIDINRLGIVQVMGEKQYFVNRVSKVNFHRALQYCAELNMTLASIESATEQQNLKNLLSANSLLSRNFWLSGNDLPLSREFVWFGTGSLFSFTSWAPGLKKNTNQRCVRTDVNFNWRREFCNKENLFICEKAVVPPCGVNGECDFKPVVIL